MDEEPALDARARRAIPLIAAALTVIVVAGLIYLRANAPAPKVVLGVPYVPQVPPEEWASYDFVSPSLGWAALVHQPAGSSTVWIFRTTDGARHWQMQFARNLPDGEPPSIQFFDHQHGIVYAGRLYRTSDGGGHWDAISLPDATPEFAFGSPTRGWALTSTSNLYSTVDGGLTWQHISANIPVQTLVGGKGGDLVWAFRADGEGWAGAGGVLPVVYSTFDGGLSWREVALPAAQSQSPDAQYIYRTSVELLPGSGVMAHVIDGSGGELAFTSLDRGGSWRQIQQPPVPTVFGDLSFLDRRQWWASYAGKLFKTFDAGQTWTEVPVIAPDLFNDWTWGPAQVIDSRHAWMTMTGEQAQYQSSALAMTSDGGVHWSAVNVPHV